MAIALASHGQGNLPGQARAMHLHVHVARYIGPASCMGDLGEHGHAGSGSGEFADAVLLYMSYKPLRARLLHPGKSLSGI
jgi:hypothetical protein